MAGLSMGITASSAARLSSSNMMSGASFTLAAPGFTPPSAAFGRRPLQVTCSGDNVPPRPDPTQRAAPTLPNVSTRPGLSSLQGVLDRLTKQELRPADIERHQAEDTSEKQSILGARPSASAPWPRPELERRPETGDRSLASLFAVDGAAPETINGRLAMVGFVWALVAEKLTGLSVMEQLFNPATAGLLRFGAVVQLFTYASVVPFFKGESTDARRFGPFTAKAERWNGRLAMLGFAALIIDEMIRQAPFLGP